MPNTENCPAEMAENLFRGNPDEQGGFAFFHSHRKHSEKGLQPRDNQEKQLQLVSRVDAERAWSHVPG